MANQDCVCWDYETPDAECHCEASAPVPRISSYAVKAYVGPCGVKPWAEIMRTDGFTSVSEGTEHVYATFEGTDQSDATWRANLMFQRLHGVAPGITFKRV